MATYLARTNYIRAVIAAIEMVKSSNAVPVQLALHCSKISRHLPENDGGRCGYYHAEVEPISPAQLAEDRVPYRYLTACAMLLAEHFPLPIAQD